MEPDVIFIGAGPVGLFTAINTKLNNPKQNILLLERNESYTRSHFLKIEGNSYAAAHPNEEFQAILVKLRGRVLTTEIEHTLKTFALSIGIQIEHAKVTDVPGVAATYPSAHTIVGADGAHSAVRAQIFDDEKEIDKNLQYIIEVKFKVAGATSALSYVETASGLTQIPHFVSENVGNTKPDEWGKLSTPVSLFFFVDKKTYEQVRNKKRGSLALDELEPDTVEMTELANSILPWLKYREIIKGDQPKALKISAVALNNYRSINSVKLLSIGNKLVRFLLIGDATLGIPFYRALNAGLIGGVIASKLLATSDISDNSVNKQFERDMQRLAHKEISQADYRNRKVTLGKSTSYVARFMSHRLASDTMDPRIAQQLRDARLSPLPFYKVHRSLITRMLLLISLIAILTLTGGAASIPIMAAVIAKISLIGVNLLLSGVLTLTLAVMYEAMTSLIRYFREPPVVTINANDIIPDIENKLVNNPAIEPGVGQELEEKPVLQEMQNIQFSESLESEPQCVAASCDIDYSQATNPFRFLQAVSPRPLTAERQPEQNADLTQSFAT